MNTTVFDRATHKAFAYVLLFSVILLPLGQHRVWMRQPGWWVFPVLTAFAFLGLAMHYRWDYSAAWRLLCLPWAGLFILDALSLFWWPWPPAKEKEIDGLDAAP